jgi:hypothetical protein
MGYLSAHYGGTAMSTPVRSPLLVGRAAESRLLDAALARVEAGGVAAGAATLTTLAAVALLSAARIARPKR